MDVERVRTNGPSWELKFRGFFGKYQVEVAGKKYPVEFAPAKRTAQVTVAYGASGRMTGQLDPGYAPNLYSLSRLYAGLVQPALAAQTTNQFLASRRQHEAKVEAR